MVKVSDEKEEWKQRNERVTGHGNICTEIQNECRSLKIKVMGFGMRTDNLYQFLKTSARGRNSLLSSKCAIKEPFRSRAQTVH